ncbi:hypothetical protein GVAV_001796 [Gurleya vavrai]
MQNKKYDPYTVVFAKFDEFPHWPARIASNEHTERLRANKNRSDGVGVLFFGPVLEWALVEESNICNFDENGIKLHGNTQGSSFAKAMEQAKISHEIDDPELEIEEKGKRRKKSLAAEKAKEEIVVKAVPVAKGTSLIEEASKKFETRNRSEESVENKEASKNKDDNKKEESKNKEDFIKEENIKEENLKVDNNKTEDDIKEDLKKENSEKKFGEEIIQKNTEVNKSLNDKNEDSIQQKNEDMKNINDVVEQKKEEEKTDDLEFKNKEKSVESIENETAEKQEKVENPEKKEEQLKQEIIPGIDLNDDEAKQELKENIASDLKEEIKEDVKENLINEIKDEINEKK